MGTSMADAAAAQVDRMSRRVKASRREKSEYEGGEYDEYEIHVL